MSGAALINNNADGANYQAQAVLAYVRYLLGDGIENSWNDETKRYQAEPKVTRFDNCREQGYAIFMRDINHDKQINIAFYEHRSSDGIEAIVSFAKTFNAPLLNDFHGDKVVKGETKYLNYGKAYELASWIVEQLTTFWDENSTRRSLAEIRAENIAARAGSAWVEAPGMRDTLRNLAHVTASATAYAAKDAPALFDIAEAARVEILAIVEAERAKDPNAITTVDEALVEVA